MIVALLAATAAAAEVPQAAPAAGPAAVQRSLMALEQAIYDGRGRGTLQPYLDNASPDYLGWPPGPAPVDLGALKVQSTRFAGSQERLTLSFTRMTLSGDTALIYYTTHMTTSASGEPVDRTYQVGHVWTWRGGRWLILGGIARAAPPAAP